MTAEPLEKNSENQDGRGKKRPGVDEQRASIRRSAVKLFGTQGTRAVSIGDICNHAEVSRPTFYRCYEDKNTLIADIYAEAVSNPAEGILLQGNLKQPRKLQETLNALFDSIFDNSDLARLVFVEAGDPGSPAASIVEESFEHSSRILAKDLKKAGQTVPSAIYLKSLMAAIQWIVHDAIKKGFNGKGQTGGKGGCIRINYEYAAL